MKHTNILINTSYNHKMFWKHNRDLCKLLHAADIKIFGGRFEIHRRKCAKNIWSWRLIDMEKNALEQVVSSVRITYSDITSKRRNFEQSDFDVVESLVGDNIRYVTSLIESLVYKHLGLSSSYQIYNTELGTVKTVEFGDGFLLSNRTIERYNTSTEIVVYLLDLIGLVPRMEVKQNIVSIINLVNQKYEQDKKVLSDRYMINLKTLNTLCQ